MKVMMPWANTVSASLCDIGTLESVSTPDGKSTATTEPNASLMTSTAFLASPRSGGLNPVPTMASRIKSAPIARRTASDSKSLSLVTQIGSRLRRGRMAAASGLSSVASLARMITDTLLPTSRRASAATRPSPPLLPLPQTTQTEANLKWARQNWATARPARCMRTRVDISGRFAASRSASRTSSVVRILMFSDHRVQGDESKNHTMAEESRSYLDEEFVGADAHYSAHRRKPTVYCEHGSGKINKQWRTGCGQYIVTE